MAKTNFAALTTHEKKVWSMQFWKLARNNSFINQFAGTSENAMVQRVTELTKTQKGDKAVITLIADLQEDGTVGDSDLEGKEEAMRSFDVEITIDQLRHANRTTGRMADQKTIVNFREQSRDKLAYWFADRMDQMAFLSLSGVPYTSTNKGGTRPVNASGYNLGDLAFAGVTAPSANRHLRWDNAGGTVEAGDTSLVEADDTLTYNGLVQAKAFAKDEYIRGIKGPGGQEIFHVFVTPQGMAKLKQDSDFRENLRHAGVRGEKNPLFMGANSYMVDGMIIHEYRHVYSNVKGTLWGAGANVKAQRTLICGAQALGMADLGTAGWFEKEFDYNNQKGIAIDKIFGFLKPVFNSDIHAADEDFGVVAFDTAI